MRLPRNGVRAEVPPAPAARAVSPMIDVPLMPSAAWATAGGGPSARARLQVELRVLPADVEKELQKGTTGYLAHTARRHEKEVEAAKKLLRGWWDQVR
jgi:hypothetical protein